mgnify:CR=1 FL=1
MQKTLEQSFTLKGIGLHSGCNVTLTLNPAPENTGIVFRRTDKAGQPQIKALWSNVVDTRNCTCLGDGENRVSTIEHIMVALYMAGIDNTLIDVDNEELPIMDGSAKVFYDAFKNIPLKEQNAPRRSLKILKEVTYTDDKGNSITLKPANKGLSVKFEIDFPSKIVGHQVFDGEITADVFEKEIAPCRTFCEKYQVDYLKSVGLIKGGSLENAVVLDGETILNEGGFRVANECVNHKVLDAIGDMYSSGYRITGALVASKTGHFHANELLKKLFADESNYAII